jgi:hypothetical protein
VAGAVVAVMACELGYMALNGDPFGAVAAQAGFDYDDRAGGKRLREGRGRSGLGLRARSSWLGLGLGLGLGLSWRFRRERRIY